MDWNQFSPYFCRKENWGDPDRMHWYHIHHLYVIRKRLKQIGCDWPFIIHNAYATSGHSDNSFHYRGLATDGHFQTNIPFYEQVTKLGWALMDTDLYPFVGIGIYPEWNNPGFHIDSRGYRTLWSQIDGEYVYDMEIIKDVVCGNNLRCGRSL